MKALSVATIFLSSVCVAQTKPNDLSKFELYKLFPQHRMTLTFSGGHPCDAYMDEDPKGHCKIMLTFSSPNTVKVSCEDIPPSSQGFKQVECSYDVIFGESHEYIRSYSHDPTKPIITREPVYKETETCQTGWHLERWHSGDIIGGLNIPIAHLPGYQPDPELDSILTLQGDPHPDKCVQYIPSPAPTTTGNKSDGTHNQIDKWTINKPCATVITGDMTVDCDIEEWKFICTDGHCPIDMPDGTRLNLNPETGMMEECHKYECRQLPDQKPMCPTKSGAWIPWKPSKGHTWHHDCVEIPIQKHWPVSTIK